MAGERSNILAGNVYNNIEGYGIRNISIPNIYSKLTQAQNYIISEAMPIEIFEVTTVKDHEEYLLEFNDSTIELKIRKIINPSAWREKIITCDLNEFEELKRENFIYRQPVKAIIIKGVLHLIPAPGESDLKIKLYAMLTGSNINTKINKETDPILKTFWDDALEYYATEKSVPVKERAYWNQKFLNALTDNTDKGHNILPMPSKDSRNYW
ncbi:MAG: hypothetical protein PVH88_02135 [Ignavibacteria bacterium]|jgi:hypothetical protein